MPFTLAHTAAVLPFTKRKHFSTSALIVGSIVPDMEFYLSLRETQNFGHSALGVLLFDIPVAYIMCFLFHLVIRNTLIMNSPDIIRKRFTSFIGFDWVAYVKANSSKVFFSIIIGIASHFFLDFFTHQEGFLPFNLSWLARTLTFAGLKVPVYSFLQISLSIIGVATILHALLKLPFEDSLAHVEKPKSKYWGVLSGFAAIVFIARLLLWPAYVGFWDLFIAAIGAMMYSLILTSLITNKIDFIHAQQPT